MSSYVLNGVVVEPRISVGEAAAKILGFNETERILEREALRHIGRYPPDEAMKLVTQSDG